MKKIFILFIIFIFVTSFGLVVNAEGMDSETEIIEFRSGMDTGIRKSMDTTANSYEGWPFHWKLQEPNSIAIEKIEIAVEKVERAK